jgi:phosphopantothenoylcysteine decarboxylase/phosphopantothenate--cysteine ligase
MRILITAGATWTKIDDIRILTNRFTGRTGLYLARGLKQKGHSVTLLANLYCLGRVKGLKIIPYQYFREFKSKLYTAVKKQRYDAIVHSAAVSDYKLKEPFRGKLASGKPRNLKLVPTEKLVKGIRRLSEALLIQFKLETKQKGIVNRAYASLKESKSDFVVANALEDMQRGYKGFLINRDKEVISLNSRKSLLDALDRIIRC